MSDDDVTGEVMPDDIYAALRHVPLAAVRRAFGAPLHQYTDPHTTSGPAECDHRNAQLYRRREWHYCPDCGKVVAK